MDNYQRYIAASRYARWRENDKRREMWTETVDRYIHFWHENKKLINKSESDVLRAAIHNLEVMPSMRCLMTAGVALDRDNVAGFNCSYLPLDHPRCFDELMYILLCGTGVGFSVEEHYTNKLPIVSEDFHATDTCILVADSKIGWAKSFKELISLLYVGQIPSWDVSKVRAAGEPLKTFGGRASGPDPLVDLFEFTVNLFKKAAGRKLWTIECHDLACKIADIVVVGGVRRSALISLSDPWDARMRMAKTGQYFPVHRHLANNSACYSEKPSFDFFLEEMKALYESKSGERGVFSRVAAKNIVARNGRRDPDHEFGTNPCSEIILRPFQFCNLSEVVIRAEDTLESLTEKVKVATILGTLQSTLTDFRYLRPIWKKNTEEECLLGVSMTGIEDNGVMAGRVKPTADKWGEHKSLESILEHLNVVAVKENATWAKKLNVNASTAITCVKPSGTVSQLVNSASGIHPRFSPYYIRTVRADNKDPLSLYMQEAGFPCEVDVTKSTNLVFSFPIKAPKGALCAKEVGAIQQLELWKTYQNHWAEHKPSITVYYTDDEFFEVCSWVWKNFDILSGIALLPIDDHAYRQPPYQEITKEEYEAFVKLMPVDIDWAEAAKYENGRDSTTSLQTLACSGGICEI